MYSCCATCTGQRHGAYSSEGEGHCAGVIAKSVTGSVGVEKNQAPPNVVACPGRRAAACVM